MGGLLIVADGSRHLRYCRSCAARLARDNPSPLCAPCQRKERALADVPPEVPAEFWVTGRMREALGSWHIGQVIRAYRHHPFHGSRPLPQELVAGWLSMTQTQLSRVESGPPVEDLFRLRAWARVLQIPGHLLWFKLPEEREEPRSDVREPVHQLAAVSELSALLPACTLSGEDAGESAEHCIADAMAAFRAADRQVGGGHLYGTVTAYLRAVAGPALFGGPNVAGPATFAAVGALSGAVGWMAYDAGLDKSALRHFHHALGLAQAGSDRQLSADVMASMSNLALHQAEPGKAIQLARTGRRTLRSASRNPRLAARLWAMEARGLAALPRPDRAASRQALESAEEMLGMEPGERSSAWVATFDEASLASETARALRDLGELRAAAGQARRVGELRSSSHVRSRAFGQLLLAETLIAQDQVGEAVVLARQVLDATRSLGSYLVAMRLENIGRLLRVQRAVPAATEFLRELQEARRHRLWLEALQRLEAVEAAP